MKSLQWKYESPVGPLFLIANDKGISGLYWEEHDVPYAERPQGFLKQAIDELEEYFNGKRKTFTVPLDFSGTTFQMNVWKKLQEIPYGKTWSYKDLARKIKNENAIRAVGTANGRNPISIFVPCHRVIASDGTLAGYAGGLNIKKKLLELEGHQAL